MKTLSENEIRTLKDAMQIINSIIEEGNPTASALGESPAVPAEQKTESKPRREEFELFASLCRGAIGRVKGEGWYHGEPLDFRVRLLMGNDEVSGLCFTTDRAGLMDMYSRIVNASEFECELYVNYVDENRAESADHGIYLISKIMGVKVY